MELNHWVTAVLAVFALVLSAFNLSETAVGRIRRVWPLVEWWLNLLLQVLGVCMALFVIVHFLRQDGIPSRSDIAIFVLAVVSIVFYVVAAFISALVRVMKSIVGASSKLADIALKVSGGDSGDSPPNSST